MREITHERCSELLGGHLRGELGPEDAAAVEYHLAGCDDCRAELSGLRALYASDDFEPLRDEERRKLRGAVTHEARLAPARVVELPARRSFWERHAGQIVGAAASIVVILFAVLVFQGLGGDDAGESAVGGGDAGGDDGAATAEQDALEAGGPEPLFVTSELRAFAEGAQDESATTPRSALKDLQNRPVHTERSIQRLGESGPIFRDFSEAYTTDDAGLAENFLNQLASEADDAELRDRILECGAELLGDDPERPLLPAFATVAEFKGEEALILGFVTSDGLTPELNRYSTWAWSVDSCDEILIGTSGDISP